MIVRKKLINLLHAVCQVRLLSTSLRKSILTVDNGEEYLAQCLPSNATSIHIPIRGEFYYLNIRIGLTLICLYLKKRRLKIGLRGCYVAAIAKSVRPKVIVTMIDNNNWDLNLADFLNIPILCIANGVRQPWHLEGKKFNYYFAISTALVDSRLPFNCHFDEFIPSGHIKMGIYLEMHGDLAPPDPDEPLSLLWISQFREAVFNSSSEYNIQQKKATEFGLGLMARYAREKDCAARVATASGRKGQDRNSELAFISSATEGLAEFSGETTDEWISYKEASRATIVFGLWSTLLFECLSIDHRVVFIIPAQYEVLIGRIGQAIRLDLLKPLIYSGDNYPAFAMHCDSLLAMSDENYRQLISGLQEDIAPFDKSYLPQHQVRDKISAILE